MRNQRNPASRCCAGFGALIVTQFEGAFNDNALKMVVTFVGLNMALSQGMHDALVPLTAALVLAAVHSVLHGRRLSGRPLQQAHDHDRGEGAGDPDHGLCHAGPAAAQPAAGAGGDLPDGVHSAFFGPSKYGLLPELLPERRLSWGNGILELGTFLAIITGMAAGGGALQELSRDARAGRARC